MKFELQSKAGPTPNPPTDLRTTCDWVGKELECCGIDAAVYHAGKEAQQRNRVQSDWSSGDIQVVVATVAFGMGIDRGDVRCANNIVIAV